MPAFNPTFYPNDLGVCLELVRAYLKGAQYQTETGPLVKVPEQAVAEKVLMYLRAVEHRLTRGQPR